MLKRRIKAKDNVRGAQQPVAMAQGRMPTARDVARLANVSQSAVSVVLRNKEGNISVSEPVRRRIQQAAAALNYRPNRSARNMRLQRTNTVGFITTSFIPSTGRVSNHVIHPFVVGLNRELASRDFHVVLLELGELEQTEGEGMPRALRERFFDGLVVHIGLSTRALDMIRACGLPVIFFDMGLFEPERCLYRDERRVGRASAELLYDAGHRRIAFYHQARHWHYLKNASDVFDHFSYRHRIEGFEGCLRERGLEPLHLVNDGGPAVMAQRLRELAITGMVITGGDRLPGPLMQAIMEAGLRVPQEISIASCDVEKLLTTQEFDMGGVIFDRFAAGTMAGQAIMRLIEGPDSHVASETLAIETRLGDTVACAAFEGLD